MSAVRVTHLDHVTVLVTDLAAARAFYGGALGLREIAPPKEFDFVAVWYDLGGQYLHLLKKPHPDTPSPRHFCLHVTDAVAAREHLRGLGLQIDETVKIAAADRFFVRDPDGNRVELLQWVRPYAPETDGRMSG
jgi:catechol 2,3-dioxygenase-like lactoylglutathione lyase family enzyme